MDPMPKLECKIGDLEVGVEFSYDKGRSWVTVRTEPKYLSDESTVLHFMVSPWDDPSLSKWEEFKGDEWDHVLLERTWRV
jgi:lipopolysaccharide biosynthesis glycosyltransferase